MSASVLLAPAEDGLTRASRDAAGHWTVEQLLSGHRVNCLTSDPLHQGVLYAGTQGAGLLRSDDRGRTWRGAGLEGQIVKAVAVSRVEPAVIYAGLKPAQVLVSRDEGGVWRALAGFADLPSHPSWYSPAEPPGTAYVQAIGLSPHSASIILAGMEAGAVVRSVDGGETWQDHRPGALRDCHTLAFHPESGEWVYMGGGDGGAAFSRDAGETWERPTAGLDRHYGWACAVDPVEPEVRYLSAAPSASSAHRSANAQAGIFRQAGSGRWRKLAGGLPEPLAMPYALLTDPSAPGHVYAVLRDGEVWHSLDQGDSWQRLPVNLGPVHRTAYLLPE